MSTYGQYVTVNMEVSGDMSSYQYYLVEPTSTAKRVQRATTGSLTYPMGVLYDDPDAAGAVGLVAVSGEVKCQACADSLTLQGVTSGSSISCGNWLAWDTAGQLVKAPTSACAHVFARSLEAMVSGSGVIRVLVTGALMVNTN